MENRPPTRELSPEQKAKQALAQANVEDLRARQMDVLNDAAIDVADKPAKIEELITDYLGGYGIEMTDPIYADYRSVIRALSADNMTNASWRYGQWDPVNQVNVGKTGFDILHDEQQRILGHRLDDPTYKDQAEFDADFDEAKRFNERFDARLELDEARESLATVSAKRQGRLFGKGKDGESIRTDYDEKLRKLGILELDDLIDASDDETTKNAKVIAYLFEEQKKLRELTTEKLKNTKVGKFVKFMNKGNYGVRFLKGMAFGAVLGGTAAVFFGGAGAVAGAGAAMLGVGRFVRGYAAGDKYRGMQTAEEAYFDGGSNRVEIEASDGPTIEDKFKAAASIYDDEFEKDTSKEQRKRIKALGWGATSVVLGATVGYALSEAPQHLGGVSDAAKNVVDNMKDFWNNNMDLSPGTDVDTGGGSDGLDVDPNGDIDGDGQLNGVDHDRDGDGIWNKDDATPNKPDLNFEISDEARYVERGEGWYQTFNELGIPEYRWEETLELAGPELKEQGWAYFDDAANEWRISQPGRLSDGALTTIANSAKRAGFTLAA